ncbi:integrin alpha-X [Fukomys damarensis]|nr:integrin alpha-X [Fukomys damarensis]
MCDSAPVGIRGTRSTRCSINHLILRGGTQITFSVTFDVSPKAVLGDWLLVTANVSSENNTPRTSKTTFQRELPVKYAVYTVISRCPKGYVLPHSNWVKWVFSPHAAVGIPGLF